jgi:hypothetical protein
MTIVVVDLTAHAFRDTMKTMRLWLDAMHCEPSRFTYAASVARIEFAIPAQAQAFAQRFDGKLLPRDARA